MRVQSDFNIMNQSNTVTAETKFVKRRSRWLLYFGLFFVTLHEFYYESPIGFIRIFEFLGVGVFLLGILIHGGKLFQCEKFLACMGLVLLGYLLPLMTVVISSSSSFIYWNTVLGMPISMCMAIVFLFSFSAQEQLLFDSYRFALIVHLFFFYFQFAIFVVTGTVLNYLAFLGREQRMIGGDFTEESLLRCAGLTGEPAAFSLTVVLLLAPLCWGGKRIPWKIAAASIVAVLLSFSAMGYFYLLCFAICFLFPVLKSFKIWISIFSGVLSIGVLSFFLASEQIFRTYEKLVNFQDSGSYQYRIGTFLSYVISDPWGSLWGEGLGVQKGLAIADGTLVGSGSTYSTVFLSCGLLLGTGIFLLIWKTMRRSFVPKLACIFIFATFMGTNTPSQLWFWISIFGLAIICYHRFKNTNFSTDAFSHHRIHARV